MPPPGVCMSIMNARHKGDGYGTVDNPEVLFKQEYKRVKEFCINRQVRYIDEMFPPDTRSIGNGILKPGDLNQVQWLRPGVSFFYWLTLGGPSKHNLLQFVAGVQVKSNIFGTNSMQLNKVVF